jgi:hypothetical protein
MPTNNPSLLGQYCTRAFHLKRLGFSTYQEYLASDHWRNLRKRYNDSDLPQRCVCGRFRDELHHCTYERLGEEFLTDLVPLCWRCHDKLHLLLKTNPSYRLETAHLDLLVGAEPPLPPKKVKKKKLSKKKRMKERRERLNASHKAQVLIQCGCGRRAWQNSNHCPRCGKQAAVVRNGPV